MSVSWVFTFEINARLNGRQLSPLMDSVGEVKHLDQTKVWLCISQDEIALVMLSSSSPRQFIELLPNIYRYYFLKGDCYQCFSAPSGLQQQGDLTGFIPLNLNSFCRNRNNPLDRERFLAGSHLPGGGVASLDCGGGVPGREELCSLGIELRSTLGSSGSWCCPSLALAGPARLCNVLQENRLRNTAPRQ